MTREPNPRDDRVGQASVEALQHVVDAITISEYVTGDDACIETSPQRFAGSVCVMSCFPGSAMRGGMQRRGTPNPCFPVRRCRFF